MTTLNWIFFGLALLATWHFVYEGILAPSLRMSLRYRIFELRDQLRTEMYSDDSEASTILQSQMNTSLQVLSEISISDAYQVRKYIRANPNAQEEARRRMVIVENSANPKLKKLADQLSSIIIRAFVVNTGGWIVYVVPLALSWILLKKLRNGVRVLLNLPEMALQSIFSNSARSLRPAGH